MNFPILSFLILLPSIGAFFLFFTKSSKETNITIKYVALFTSLVNFFLSIYLWILFDQSTSEFQFVENRIWIKNLINYKVGIDGISILFIILTTFITPLCIISVNNSIKNRLREFLIAILIMESFMIGVFCSLDLVVFYLFFEAGFPADLRNYGVGAQILTDLGIKKLKLLTNNPRKIAGLGGYGIEVIERVPLVICPNDNNAEYLSVKKTKLGHMIDEENSNTSNIDPFISIFLDGNYKSIDLVPLKNKVIKFCDDQNINIKLESTPRLLAFWNRPKLVWRIIHDRNRTNTNITDEEIKNIELFIQFLSNYENSTKIGIIVSRNIEQALHPKSSIKLINTKFTINNEILYSSTRKFNLDKETFSIVFEG